MSQALTLPRGREPETETLAGAVVFIDSEIDADGKIRDLGAVRLDGASLHTANLAEFAEFAAGADFLCGHNIFCHDLKYLAPLLPRLRQMPVIDTLHLSPLLFPQRPYHALLKDDKLQADELNNPLNDAEKARRLFCDEVNAFRALAPARQQIAFGLLGGLPVFSAFFACVGFRTQAGNLASAIRNEFAGEFCEHTPLETLMQELPAELAYTLALLGTGDHYSITPPWLLHAYPKIEYVMQLLRGTPCPSGCAYCCGALNLHRKLEEFFGFAAFRSYGKKPLQEQAAQAAVDGKSLLAIFPTGGGKSLTFQLPALMAGQAERGLTVVISPLQSLMKDQVDSLSERGITDAVTVNGLLSPIERAEALERAANGLASLLYISPEQLRSPTIEKLLLSRHIVRFVIDEAHCFSAWGQDFRVDYLYIGDFIRQLQKKKGMAAPVPVSCFTATAKQKVIRDICDYFRGKLGLELELFSTSATRKNLHYTVRFLKCEEEKYNTLRALLEQRDCPAIVYASRTRRTQQLADKLTRDGFPALPYHGRMSAADKTANQEAFMQGQARIIVATSAFGMGVDKKDVGLVVHYDISDSLENYVQEAGRAGRDPAMSAECCILFCEGDLDKHFTLLNQTKLSMNEIQQVWRALKAMTHDRPTVSCSALEIARAAGWDQQVSDMETRIRTAISALESAGYLRRGNNMPRVYATSIRARNMEEAGFRIDCSPLFDDAQRQDAKRIIQALISSRSRAAEPEDAESRVDYLADRLGLEKRRVIASINQMRQEGLLADSMDMSAVLRKTDSENRSAQTLERFLRLERFLLTQFPEEPGGAVLNLKKLNEAAVRGGNPHSSVKNIRTLLYYLTIRGSIRKREFARSEAVQVELTAPRSALRKQWEQRGDLCRFLVRRLYALAEPVTGGQKGETAAIFSLVGLHQDYLEEPRLGPAPFRPALEDVQDALLYLSRIGALRLEGGFLVLYQGMQLQRLVRDNKIRYKVEDYKTLGAYYQQKVQQIHVVGEYARLMAENPHAAMQFLQDYFQMNYRRFLSKYFPGERGHEINRNITPEKYRQLFGSLSEIQEEIIGNAQSPCIVVAAGPGSGKTRVLVHKLASLLLLEEVKHEQLLMLTFSRAAATEFKKRLLGLIGNAANFIEIKTFHSYCFDLLGRTGSLEGAENVVRDAARMIERGEVEPGRVAKAVLVIDEAQDMDEDEFALVRALRGCNDDLRIIAVGDDDQNIYAFRGSDSRYLRMMAEEPGAVQYEMTQNYRSRRNLTALANAFAQTIGGRMKSAPIEAMRTDEPGIVRIVRHTGGNLEQPLVEQLLQTWKGGRACVLTGTNDEALRVLGLLHRHGVRARLIQSTEGFRLYDLAELRLLLKTIGSGLTSPVISDANWEAARQQLRKVYHGSACLAACLRLMEDFERTNPYTKYFTDFEEFIRESNYEDFCGDGGESVFVSTIHKAKGREFDCVYMLLDHLPLQTDDDRRTLYVGMTRARDELYIHCSGSRFEGFEVPGVEVRTDPTRYPAPAELVLQLTLRDVVLDDFLGRKKLLLKLRSGMPLGLRDGKLTAEVEGRRYTVARLSRACQKRLEALAAKGYQADGASVRFVIAWRKQDAAEETAALLADLHLARRGAGQALGQISPEIYTREVVLSL